MESLLFGHNPEERIVAVQQKDDSTMRLYFRHTDGVRSRDENFFPFFYLAEQRLIEGFKRNHWVKELEGPGRYKFLCVFEEWPAMWDAVRYILDAFNRTAITKVETYTGLDVIYLHADPVTQYLLQSGRTLFKGLVFEDLHRMQLDIETYTSSTHRFSNANRPGDRIILIALSDNRGWQHLIDGKKMTERQMLLELNRIVAEQDPDVIEGHNIFNFDLPYILTRATLNNVVPGLGRDGSPPRTFESRTSFAEHPFEYTAADIEGRHIIDTLLLVQNYDATKRNMESYGLKYAAQYFGLASPERTYIPGDRISWYWDNDPGQLMKYALDDVGETGRLSEHLSASSFYLTQIVPASYGTVTRMGSATKIESLLVREYLRRKHALPKPQEGVQTTGGYTDIFLSGILGPVIHADVESLYPSLMITKSIAPASDVLNVFHTLLGDLTGTRIATKREMQAAADPVERSRLDAMQSSLKILINSFYGYLGYSRALFNDYRAADQVTQTGQEILRSMMGHIRSAGGRVIEVDTDGIFFVPPPGITGEEDERRFVAELSNQLPEGITVALDGRYRKMLSYKKKNYALLSYDEKIRIRGSSLVSRSMEQFGRRYIRECIERLLNDDIAGLHELYVKYYQNLAGHKFEVTEFARVESLKDSLAVYLDEVKGGKRNRSAAYEVAARSSKPIKQGDRIAYYITGGDPNVRSFENCRGAEEWDPNFPDENTAYYLRRLDEFSEKFADLFLPREFSAIFKADDLFPFDPTGIAPRVADMSESGIPGSEEPQGPQFGIWIDE